MKNIGRKGESYGSRNMMTIVATLTIFAIGPSGMVHSRLMDALGQDSTALLETVVQFY
jgi:hypothetical protein